MSAAWGRGSTRAWRRTRKAVLDRDATAGYGCRAHEEGWCKRQQAAPHACARIATHVHHTRGKAGGDHHAHLVSACEACNLAIGEPPSADPPTVPITKWR